MSRRPFLAGFRFVVLLLFSMGLAWLIHRVTGWPVDDWDQVGNGVALVLIGVEVYSWRRV